MTTKAKPRTPLGALAPFAGRPKAVSGSREASSQPSPCEMCAAPIPDEHEHLVRIGMPGILCVCRPCRLLLSAEGAGHGKFKAVPDRWASGAELSLEDHQWMRLGIPVRIAFFVVDSSRGYPIGFYPSPGGAIQAELDEDSRRDLLATVAIRMLEPDVEAWLVDGRDRDASSGWVVPLNAAYELVARLRMSWEGFSGGPRARAALESFFERARRKSGDEKLA